MAIEHVEHFPTEIQPEVFREIESLGKTHVLVVGRKRSDLGIVASDVAKGGWLTREVGGNHKAIDGRIKLIPCDRGAPVIVARDGWTCRASKEKRRKGIVSLQGYGKST